MHDLPEVEGTRQLGCWPSAYLYFPSTSSSENLPCHDDKTGAKHHWRIIHCTIGRIKARNSAERLSFSFSKKTKYRIWRLLENDPQSAENEVVVFPPFVFVSILLQCTGCTLNYYSNYYSGIHCC